MEEQILTITVRTKGEPCPLTDAEIREWYAAKIAALRLPRGITVRAALVYDGELSPAVEAGGFFDALVPASKLLGF